MIHASEDGARRRVRRRRCASLLLGALLAHGSVCRPARGAGDEPPVDRLTELVRRGNAARRQGQIDDALAAYREARQIAPERYEVRMLLADTLRRSGRLEEAAPEYASAVGLDPGRPEAYSGQALLRRAAFDFDGAAAILEGGIAKVGAEGRPDLLLSLAETRRRQGRLPEAERVFGEALASRPGNAPALAGLAQVAEARGDLAAALAHWDRYLARKPEDEAAELRRDELTEIKASIAALRETAGRSPDAQVLAELGRLLAVAGDPAGAVDAYRRALALGTNDPDARRGLALALLDRGDARAAAAQFRRVLKIRPRDAVALYNLSGLARASGDLEAEVEAWRVLIGERPDDLFATRSFVATLERAGEGMVAKEIDRERREDAATGATGPATSRLRLRTLLLASARRWDEAAATLDRALGRDATDPWTQDVANEVLRAHPAVLRSLVDGAPAGGRGATQSLLLLARLTWWGGREGEALVLLRQAVAADPGSALARSALAEGYQSIGHDGTLALQEMTRAVELDPGRVVGHVDLAMGLLRAGRAKQAEAAARRALALDPESAPALSLLGAALADQADLEGAAVAYAAALRSDPADNFGLARVQYPLMLSGLGRHVESRRALRGEIPPIPEALYHEAWRFAGESYRDRSLHDQDWGAWRDRFRGRLATVEDAYRAIAVMLASLGDPYTRLRDPEETAAVFLARHGGGASVDPLGRNRPQSKTVIARDLPGGLGYIRLSNLTDPRVVAEVRKALGEMREKERIILDLRGNGGGFARSADAIGDLLVGPGRPAGVDIGPEGTEERTTGGDGALVTSPLTVLVDGQTASAAERLARTLAASGRGTIVGDPTHGKGLAQATRVLPGGATVLVSAAEMLGQDGRPLQGRGLRPASRVPPD